MKTYDKLWKGIIEDLFEEFLHFFFPDNVHLVDFSKGFEFLDQELDLLFPETTGKDRRVDKLVKVFLLTGEEAWFLLHIEVQGYYDSSFEERMFTSYYRISDRFGKKIAALAIFTDKQVDFNPNIYVRDFWGTKVEYTFPTYKVILQNKESLKKSENPFAIVILSVIAALEKGNANDEEIKSIKWELARLLYGRNYTKKSILKIFDFINYYIRFADTKKYTKFAYEVHNTYQKELQHGY